LTNRILITGNMGYVGPVVVRHLRRVHPGSQLIGVDAGFFAHCLTGAAALPEHRLDTQHFMDVRDIPEALLDGVDAVIHLAAISNDPMGTTYEEVTAEVNYQASVRLAELARRRGVKRFVFASSCSVYGLAEGGPRPESAPLNPLTAYARSKIDTECRLEGLAGSDFTVTCLRFPTACGMSERLRLDLVLNDFVASAVANGRIEILSDGSPWRPLIDVRDMALAMEWALEREGEACLAVNVGRNECNYQVRELARVVQAEMPDVSVAINEKALPDKRSYQVDFGLYAELAPRHLPRFDLRDSTVALIDGLRGMGFATSRFRESGLIRLKVLTGLRENGLLDERLRWAQ
jgi:nucleoside-diphosphate-sugar epimerase